MILTSAAKVDDPDVTRYAWSRLRRFRNISEVEDRIIRLHQLGTRHRANAKKQATQLRHCLIQAQEYFDAATAVTLATKPVLYYYCIMSLALAEVLLKQSGREQPGAGSQPEQAPWLDPARSGPSKRRSHLE
jgi:YaaC-like Protein